MKKIILEVAMFITFSFLFYNCSEENNPVTGNTPIVDPITNTWTSESNNDYQIFFQTFDSLVTRGVFSGIEFHPEEGETELCGFFDGTYVEFDVRRPFGSRTKFKGNFINSNRIELESSEGTLIITR
jgi:hypothetical protein